jgi:putative ABC transport system permease protein
MNRIALRMLTGDPARYAISVFGVAFASLLISHQLSVFLGVMDRTCSIIYDAHPAGIWVMDPLVLNLDDARPLREGDVLRVRGVPGVAWAATLFKGQALVHNEKGGYRQVILVGGDPASLYGLPTDMVLGSADALKQPDAVMVDEAGYSYLWPGEPLAVGRELKINGGRAVLVGVCRSRPPFLSNPVLFARTTTMYQYVPAEQRRPTFLLVHPADGEPAAELCDRIHSRTGLAAVPGDQFARNTKVFFLSNTAIMYNFALVVGLGFVIGVAVAGQTFYLFTVHHLRHYANLKAMGVVGSRLARMVLLQAAVIWAQGFCLGVGLAAVVFEVSTRSAPYLAGFVTSWPAVAGAAASTAVIMALASLASVYRVYGVDVAAVMDR